MKIDWSVDGPTIIDQLTKAGMPTGFIYTFLDDASFIEILHEREYLTEEERDKLRERFENKIDTALHIANGPNFELKV